MAAHPGITVELPFLENEAFKAKLTTLLQSPDAPDIFHSWGGGVFAEQAKAGVLRPIDDVLTQEAPRHRSAPPASPPSPRPTATSTASPATSAKS